MNLAIPGELSSSFISGTAPDDWLNRIPALSLHYGNPPVSQFALMQSTIQQAHLNGDSIAYVSLLFGSNDVFQRVATTEFQNATPEQQQLLLGQTITSILGNYQTVLNELVTTAPEARIILPNYYNPYPDFLPEGQLYEAILANFNPAVEQLANAYGASYVDLYTVFDGRQLELTNIGTLGDVHPNQLGYQAAGSAMISVVPEPSTAIAWVGLLLVGSVWRRQRPETASNQLAA